MNTQENIKRILREELLREGNIEIPQSEIDKAGILLDIIKSKLDTYRENTIPMSTPVVDYKNYFKILDKDGKPNYVSVGIYNDGNDVGAARMDVDKNTLLINVNSWEDDVDIPLDYFEDIITHELVHSVDPLLKDTNRFMNYEYNAELTTLINKIRRVVKNDKTKMKWMFWMINNIKKINDVEEIYRRTEQYFENGDNPLFKNTDDYWYYLSDMFNIIKPWSKRPTLFKKFLNDLYIGITK